MRRRNKKRKPSRGKASHTNTRRDARREGRSGEASMCALKVPLCCYGFVVSNTCIYIYIHTYMCVYIYTGMRISQNREEEEEEESEKKLKGEKNDTFDEDGNKHSHSGEKGGGEHGKTGRREGAGRQRRARTRESR